MPRTRSPRSGCFRFKWDTESKGKDRLQPSDASDVTRLRTSVIATGFTTALLGDERTLREFIVGEHMRAKQGASGSPTVLILINDSYDPLTERQLRVGVNKGEALLERFRPFCGRPISEIPDPFECHSSYSEHFTHGLIKRLHYLGIHPVVLDTYQAYQRGYYLPFVRTTFENYDSIQQSLAETFSDFTMRNLYRPRCPKCLTIDATNVLGVDGESVRFSCERCGHTASSSVQELQGKLSWKLDCAARWNLYGVDLEVFSKAHVADTGTLGIAKLMSTRFFGGCIPAFVTYGEVKMDRDLSGRLLEILPPQILTQLFLTHMRRDLHLTKDSVENFCHKVSIAAGMSYVDYVRWELPKRAVRASGQDWVRTPNDGGPETALSDPVLIAHGLRFARFYYDRDHALRLPDMGAVESEDHATAAGARGLIGYAVAIREESAPHGTDTTDLIRSHMFREPVPPRTFRYLRRIFRQHEGPKIAALLACLPVDYLRLVERILEFYADGRKGSAAEGAKGKGECPTKVAEQLEPSPRSARPFVEPEG